MRSVLRLIVVLSLLSPLVVSAQEDEASGESGGDAAAGESEGSEETSAADDDEDDEVDSRPVFDEAASEEVPAADGASAEAPAAEEGGADDASAEGPPWTKWKHKWWAKTAGGAERPGLYLYVRGRVGLQFFPLGLVGELIAIPQFALKRSDSVFFQTTFAGVGLYLRGSPAFFEIGPRFVIRPIEIFQVGITGLVIGHWKSNNGRVPFDELAKKTYADRQNHPYEAIRATTLYVDVSPVLRLKAGPVIILYGASVAYQATMVDVPDDQLMYDPALDLLIYRRDVTLNQQVAVLPQILDGKDTAVRLRLGATFRHRTAFFSKDTSMNVGFIGTFKPGRRPGWPDILVSVMPYVRDTDRVLGPPWMAVAFTWEIDPSLKKRSSVDSAQAAMRDLDAVFGGRSF